MGARAGIAKRNQTAEGRLVGTHTFTNSLDVREMHPKGSEVVMCTTGAITLIQEAAGGAVVEVTLGPGEYAINEPGVRHTADVVNSAKRGSWSPGWARSTSRTSSWSFETALTHLLRMTFFFTSWSFELARATRQA